MTESIEEFTPLPGQEEAWHEDEKKLLEIFVVAKDDVEKLTTLLDMATKKKNKIEDKLIKLLEDDDKSASARYDDLGHVIIVEGAAYASIEKGRADDVIAYLKSIGRDDMIRNSVHSATLSSYVRECLKENKDIPPGTTFYKPKGLRFYPIK